MRKPLLIVGVVAAYALFETALLLVYLLPSESMAGSQTQHALLACANFLTIPGMAALFSLILFGCYQWKRRLILFLFAGPGLLVLILLMVLPVALFPEWVFNKWGFDAGNSIPFSIAGSLYAIIILGSASLLLFSVLKKTAKHSIELEASRWQAEREAGVYAIEQKRQERAVRWALCIPSLMVLGVFLFLPEMWAALTHAQQPLAGNLPGYEVSIPGTWVILANTDNSSTGTGWVSGIAVGSLWKYIRQNPGSDLPLSDWAIGIAEDDYADRTFDRLNRNEPRVQRDFQIGRATLTCFEYHPSWAGRLTAIECRGPNRLRARFTGERIHVPAFYGMLASMTPALPHEVK